MTIDIEKLKAFPVPEVRETLRPNDIALYALSIGLGRDPLDREQLRFVDPLQGPEVVPSMVLVMAHPGFWMGDPASGVDPKAVLHASQAFEILAELPKSGEVESQTHITDIIDKGEGKAALVQAETQLRDENGVFFARLNRTFFIRGGGGFGGSPGEKMPRPEAPQTAPDHSIDMKTHPEQALLYRLNGDFNPLHSDPDLAIRAGFDRPILHGLCTMGVAYHAILKSLAGYQPERLRSIRLNFSKPVFPGETIRTEIWNDGRFQARVVERDVIVIDGGQVETTGTGG
ncbi:MaoC/PaaZ C-terminal domain-containing protein [Roseovarius indicus]|uniref:MaoC/PaaZ C-terminal domain-containing protein n=1 Tax=Roseovarius indicus TaxID=540747 RepID=UPI0007D95B99|nr:MaoC/PaaZ C-terminal domain-containing protein [Roseovarius indicus]OAO01334.1 3-alpha,7-alpha,12-alpha-trihydroxy-5-beta-cholest-24-enoyl-CoA hydratase [Roseovarius indicus]